MSSSHKYSYGPEKRLRGNRQVRQVLAERCSAGKGIIRLYISPNNARYSRFGVSVNRKLGTAVRRNRIKRLAREVFRLNQYKIPTGYDYLLILSPKWSKKAKRTETESLSGLSFEKLEHIFLDCVNRAHRRKAADKDRDA